MISYRKFLIFLTPWLAIAFVMNLVRVGLVDTYSYLYMNWNLFLAFLSLFFIFLFEKTKNKYLKGLSFFVWLFFLPNAIYIVTDFIHLREVGPEWVLWYDGMMIFSYAFIGIFISSYVLLRMKNILFNGHRERQNMFLVCVSFISAFGVYLGRYVRWNTWDIVVHPIDLINNIFHIINTEYNNIVFIMTLFFFTLFMLVSAKSLELLFKQKEKKRES